MKDFKIFSWEELIASTDAVFPKGTALTIGGFDGTHRGHHELFNCVLKYANRNNIPAGVITFFRSPAVIKNSNYAGDVSTIRLKLKKLMQCGFSFAILIDFSTEFAKIDGRTFFDILIKTTHLKYLAVGDDFSCGYRRGLGVSEISKLAPQMGFCFDSIKAVNFDDNLRISSTAIRSAVQNADFTLAKYLLGYPFLFDVVGLPWTVIKENSISVQRAFITQILPKCGEYKVSIEFIDGTKKEGFFFINEKIVELHLQKNSSDKFSLENLNNLETIEFII